MSSDVEVVLSLIGWLQILSHDPWAEDLENRDCLSKLKGHVPPIIFLWQDRGFVPGHLDNISKTYDWSCELLMARPTA
jgi:hypothetical protein